MLQAMNAPATRGRFSTAPVPSQEECYRARGRSLVTQQGLRMQAEAHRGQPPVLRLHEFDILLRDNVFGLEWRTTRASADACEGVVPPASMPWSRPAATLSGAPSSTRAEVGR
jgi:hypothetical protein